MMKMEVKQWMLIIIILIAVTSKPSEAGLCSNPKVETKEDLFCNQLGFVKPSKYNLIVHKKSSTESLNKYQNCTETAKPYFAKYAEDDCAITKFVDYLKKNSISYEKGISYLTHLRKYDWNMENVIDLFDTVDCSKFRFPRYCFEKFFIYREEWYRWRNESFYVDECLYEFESHPSYDPDGTRGRDIAEVFMKWLSASDNKNNNKCNCDLVFKIGVLEDGAYITGNKAYSLQDYFSICLTENLPSNVWTKDHFQSIGEHSTDFTIEDIKRFLTQAVSLANDLWGYRDFRGWEFDAVANYIGIKRQDLSTDELKKRIDLLLLALKCQFNTEDFDFFIKMTDKFGSEFPNNECKYKVLLAGFNIKSDTPGLYRSIFWKTKDKKSFNDHLNQLYEIFKSGNDTPKDCSTFASLVSDIEHGICRTNWSVDKINELIKKGGEEKQSLREVFEYLDSMIKNLKLFE